MAAIIVPAHNEASIIDSSLSTWLRGLPEHVALIVVANGCSDETATIARRYAPRVQVIEIPQASKVAALNAGDAAAEGFPRIYLDADIAITGSELFLLFEALQQPGALAVEPTPRFDLEGCSVFVRAYYRVWQELHGRTPGDVGCGALGVSKSARARFGAFPAVISDDGYVRAHFAPDEIARHADAVAVVRAPRSLEQLIKIKTRSRLGTRELSTRFPDLWQAKRDTGSSLASKCLNLPLTHFGLLPLYGAIQLLVRFKASRIPIDGYVWARDESTR